MSSRARRPRAARGTNQLPRVAAASSSRAGASAAQATRAGSAGSTRRDRESLASTTDAMLLLSEERGNGHADRQAAAMSGEASSDISAEEEGDNAASPSHEKRLKTAKRKRQWRKATNTIRKEEKEQLQRQVRELQARLEVEMAHRFGQGTDAEQERGRECTVQLAQNRRLRRELVAQQNRFASAHALLGEYIFTEAQVGSPIHQFIHLKSDWEARQTTMMEGKTRVLESARRFLDQRRPKWDPRCHIREERSFDTPNGDSYFLSFSTMQFERIHSVHSGFEAVKHFFSDLEIRISDQLAYITVREDDDQSGAEIPQNRFVSTTQSGYHLESNSLFFSRFNAQDAHPGGERGYGLVVTDYVDEDDQYPYRPSTRIRRTTSSILEVTSFEPDRTRDGDAAEPTVLLTRWVYTKLSYPEFRVAPAVWAELRDSTERWIKLLHPSTIEPLV